MKRKKSECLPSRCIPALASACVIASLAFITGCGGSNSNANDPVNASITINPVSQVPFCNSGTIGQFVQNGKGIFQVNVLGDNQQFQVGHNYLSSANIASPGVWSNNGTGLGTNNFMTVGNSSTGDQVNFNVPKKHSYNVGLDYIEWGVNVPINGSNTNSCANVIVNGSYMCRKFEVIRHFAKKTKPNFSNTSVTFDAGTVIGAVQSCGF